MTFDELHAERERLQDRLKAINEQIPRACDHDWDNPEGRWVDIETNHGTWSGFERRCNRCKTCEQLQAERVQLNPFTGERIEE